MLGIQLNRYSVSIIGLGRIAWRGFDRPGIETHAQTVAGHEKLALTTGIDPDPAARSAFQEEFGCQVSENHVKTDISVICTPPEAHLDSVAMAIQSGTRAILCEKPLAPTVEECFDIVTACRHAKIPLLVGHQRRYESKHRALRDKLAESGQPFRVTVVFTGDWLNNGTHAVDTARFLGDSNPMLYHRTAGDLFYVCATQEDGTASDIESYGRLQPGYMRAMYDDLIAALETSKQPECDGNDGLLAVERALFEERKAA